MASVLGVTALWLVFGGTHIGLATRRVRDGLVSRLGERGFVALFSLGERNEVRCPRTC